MYPPQFFSKINKIEEVSELDGSDRPVYKCSSRQLS